MLSEKCILYVGTKFSTVYHSVSYTTHACESLGHVVEKKKITIIATTQIVLSALFLPLHLNVNKAFHTDAQKHDIYHQPNSIQYKKLVQSEVLLQTTHNPH